MNELADHTKYSILDQCYQLLCMSQITKTLNNYKSSSMVIEVYQGFHPSLKSFCAPRKN